MFTVEQQSSVVFDGLHNDTNSIGKGVLLSEHEHTTQWPGNEEMPAVK